MTEPTQSTPPEPEPELSSRGDGAARRRRPRRVVRRGPERETVLGETSDDRGSHGDNDDRLLGDVPPHWGRR